MVTEPTIDFSNYSNKDLKSSLSSINRDKFEPNYRACVAEIEKRKADGTWDTYEKKKDRGTMFKVRKWVRIFALVQASGGLVGIGNYIYKYTPHLYGGMPLISILLVFFAIVLFATTTWVGWKYWKTEKDGGAWRILLVMQIPCFQISSFAYQFYSGFQLPVGFMQSRFKVAVNLASNMTLVWNPQNTGFSIAINLAPVIVLGLLNVAQRHMRKDSV